MRNMIVAVLHFLDGAWSWDRRRQMNFVVICHQINFGWCRGREIFQAMLRMIIGWPQITVLADLTRRGRGGWQWWWWWTTLRFADHCCPPSRCLLLPGASFWGIGGSCSRSRLNSVKLVIGTWSIDKYVTLSTYFWKTHGCHQGY